MLLNNEEFARLGTIVLLLMRNTFNIEWCNKVIKEKIVDNIKVLGTHSRCRAKQPLSM